MAIGMYICCVVPVIALSNVGEGILGVCMMFLLIAAATVLMVLSADKSEEKKESVILDPVRKSVQNILSTVALVLFLGLSFVTQAWHITWLVFPIMGAVRGIVFACMDLKEASKHEA